MIELRQRNNSCKLKLQITHNTDKSKVYSLKKCLKMSNLATLYEINDIKYLLTLSVNRNFFNVLRRIEHPFRGESVNLSNL